MPTNEVILGALYIHDESHEVMKLDSGSTMSVDDWVTLVDPEQFCKHGFAYVWRGTWNAFLEQWTQYVQPELALNPKEYFKVPPIEDWRDLPACQEETEDDE